MFNPPPDPLRRLVLVAASALIQPTRSQAAALSGVSLSALARSAGEWPPTQGVELRSGLQLRDGWLLRHDDR